MDAYFNFLAAMFGLFGQTITGQNVNFMQTSGEYFMVYSQGFGIGGWIMYVLVLILFVAAIAGLILLIIFGIRRLVINHKKKKGSTEQKLIEEIEDLNLELYDVTMEKERILGLMKEGNGIPTLNGSGNGKKNGKEEVKGGSRFSRLLVVDQKYKDGEVVVKLAEENSQITLKELCERFRNFACSQMRLYYSIDTVRQFFASMGTSKLILLEGISGTGKTSLPYCLGRFFKHSANICSVQPSWRDRNELIGYYNDFTKKFTETQFLANVYEATFRNDNTFIVLDEMNLARVEYYFAEFLSIMEMPNVKEWIVDVIPSPRDDDPIHLNEGKLLIPQNIWFVGTANNDDSTFTITDKVYDRAMSLFFDDKAQPFEAPYAEAIEMPTEYLLGLYEKAKEDYPLSQDNLDKFNVLDAFVIENFKLAFGNRIMKQIKAFVPCYVACGGTELEALDFLFKIKILKKFEVLNVSFLKDELEALEVELNRLFGPNEFKLSHAKIKLLLKSSR